ncbi:MAG: S-methyl-5-thioribose-1-phosphate isomerase [Acidobacteria bacterium]|nr:S-methyl-5-thioribose-1-phosphate isomerase [Acidobacteriota bacterium]
MIRTVDWTEEGVVMLDQRKLPREELYPVFKTHEEVAQAIRQMVVRGAPAIGVAAAFGIALGVRNSKAASLEVLDRDFDSISSVICASRPTAINLFWAADQMKECYTRLRVSGVSRADIPGGLIEKAKALREADIAANRRMGMFGAELIQSEARILTHCNAGELATAGYGTALGVVYAAAEQGKNVSVYADETRPFLQGARLTAWELQRNGIPLTLITDNMAGHFMKAGRIDYVIVGADRIAANGDAANKIGTYGLAVLAREHRIPFFVVAPVSTLDLSLKDGDQIPIEERSGEEVTHLNGVAVAPAGVRVANPAFDVTPHRFISAIITDRGVAREPFVESLAVLIDRG